MKKIAEAKRGNFVLVSGSLSLLEKQLNADEEPLIIAQGNFDDKQGVVAATNQRVIYVGKVLFSSVIKDVPYSKLSSILLESGLMFSTVKLEFSGGKLEIKNIDKKAAKELSETIKAQLEKKDQSEPQLSTISGGNTVNIPPQGESLYDKLSKLADLKDRGILTDEEFAAEKKKLLEGN